jgi:hypothetical protein
MEAIVEGKTYIVKKAIDGSTCGKWHSSPTKQIKN